MRGQVFWVNTGFLAEDGQTALYRFRIGPGAEAGYGRVADDPEAWQ